VAALGGGGRRETSANPDGSMSVSEYFADGQLSRRVERQGWTTQLESVYDYGTHNEQGGGTWQKETQNGTRVTKTYVGQGGATIKRENSAFGGTVATTVYSTDAFGRVVKTTGPGGASTITTYDALGRVSGTSLSAGSGPEAATSRVQRTATTFVASATLGGSNFGAGTLQTVSALNDSGGEVVLSRSWRSVDGLSSASESRGLLTTTTSTQHSNGAWTETSTGPDGTKQVRNYADGRLAQSVTCDSGGAQLSQTDFSYDVEGRVAAQTDRRDGSANLATTMTYYDGGQLRTVVTPYDAANNTGGTAYTRDVLGRETSIRLPDGSTKTTLYNDAQGTVRVSGGQTYPSETKSDAFGQVLSLTTWQDFAGNSGAATTTWTYDPSSGLVSRKQYADGKGTGYTYDSSGRLLTRTWARGVTTTYSYSPAGDLVGVVYSDGTPGVSFSYDGNGNQLTAGGISYTVSPSTLLTDSETVPVGDSARTLVRTRDALLRDTGFSLASGGTTEAAAAWTYDSAGRPASVTGSSAGAAPQTFTYEWVAGRPQLVAKVAGPTVTVQNAYEPLRDVLASKTNAKTAGGALISGFTFAVNSLGQRTSVQHSGSAFAAPAFNVYGYDGLGQVTSSNRFTGGTPEAPSGPVAGQQFGFAYDTIGNRKSATDGVTAAAYTPNALNQYTAIQEGAALTEPTYDADGNLLADGILTCQWDGENRLAGVTRADGTQVVNTYDALGRRVRKTVRSGGGTVTSDTAYVYDGWNVIAEYNLASGSPALAAVNTWGLDLSNSRQGAGGVGGLLARATSAATLAYTFDGNGNVSELVTAAGSVAGHYEYGPFGQTVAQNDLDPTGAFAANPFRFSTKPLDADSGLYYYGYRFYSPVTGRWLSRDPIGDIAFFEQYSKKKVWVEIGKLWKESLKPAYVFVSNSPIILVDTNGLTEYNTCREAAEKAGAEGRSQAQGTDTTEYCGRICKNKKTCKFTYTIEPGDTFADVATYNKELRPGQQRRKGSCSISYKSLCSTLGSSYDSVAIWHTHPSTGGPSGLDKQALGGSQPGFITRKTPWPFDGDKDETIQFGPVTDSCQK
jgi:RHS repeat-associated protein